MAEDVFDKITDELIDKAIPEYLNDADDNLEDEKECEHVFSDRHNKMMNSLFENVAQKERISKVKRLSKVVAIFMICSISFSLMLLPNACAIKEKIVSLFFKDKNWYSILENNNNKEVVVWQYEGKEVDIAPFTYLPLGFEIKSFKENEYSKRIKLVKKEEYIEIRLAKNEEIKIDTEKITPTYLKINNIPIIYYEKDGRNTFLFSYGDNLSILIGGNAKYENFVKIIEKME